MFKFPYTNLHELNLDWILEKVKHFAELIPPMETAVEDVQALQTDVEQAVEDANQALEDAGQALETAEEAKEIAEQAAQGTIADGAVTTPKIADGAVTTAKILNGTIIAEDMATGAAVGNIADETLPGSKITPSSILGSKLADGAAVNRVIGDGAVTTVKIAQEAITQDKLDSNLNSLVESIENSNIIEQTGQDSVTLEFSYLSAVGQYDQIRFFVPFPFVTKNTNYTVTNSTLEITNIGATTLNVYTKTKNGFSAYASLTGASGVFTLSSLSCTITFSDT